MSWLFTKPVEPKSVGPKKNRPNPKTWYSLAEYVSRNGVARSGLNRFARRRVAEVVEHYQARGFPPRTTLRAGLGALRSSGASRTPLGSVVEREILTRLRRLPEGPTGRNHQKIVV